MASISGAIDLPPGFRFHPTDEEIITHYLSPKVVNPRFSATAVGEVDLNKCEPWDLPGKVKMGEKEWYFCKRDKKYPTGMRTNRATESGYWKATGKDKEIFSDVGVLVGMKKTLVFYMGRAPKGEKSNWVMHEFRLDGKQLPYIRTSKVEWVICMIFQKRVASVVKSPIARINSFSEDMPELSSCIDPTLFNSFSRPELSYDQDVFRHNYGLSSRHNQVGIFNPPQTSGFFPQNQTSSAHFQFPVPASAGYMHQNLPGVRAVATTDDTISTTTIMGHRKTEHFSSHSPVSGETGHSTDRNTEISLEAMKHYRGSSHSFDDLGNPDEPFIDLDSIWK